MAQQSWGDRGFLLSTRLEIRFAYAQIVSRQMNSNNTARANKGLHLMTLRVKLDGQVRDDLALKKYLASNGKWLSISESKVRRMYERHSCIPDKVQFTLVRIYICLVRNGETRVVRTENWGESKRLRLYEADVVIDLENLTNISNFPSLECVVQQVSSAALLALAQIALQYRCPMESAIELAKESEYGLEELQRLGFHFERGTER